jgi:hypothetical protein
MEEGSKPLTDVLTYSFVTVPNFDVPKLLKTMDKTFDHYSDHNKKRGSR